MPIHKRLLRLPNWAMNTSHLQNTKTGIYRYRRRVPDALRPLIGKTEIVISLRTSSPDDAKVEYARVHADVERLFSDTKKRGVISEADAYQQAQVWLRSKGLEEKPYANFNRDEHELDGREELVDQLLREHGYHGGLPHYEDEGSPDPALNARIGVMLGAYSADNKPKKPLTISTATDEYVRVQQQTVEAHRNNAKFAREREAVSEFVISVLGDVDITTITRQQARQVQEAYQRTKLSPASINKYTTVMSTILKFAYIENDIDRLNPFRELTLPTPPAREARDAMSIDQAKAFLNALDGSNEELQSIAKLLFLTGARLGEIVGLCVEEISFAEPASIKIKHNVIRRVKNNAANRSVPLIGIGKQLVETAARGKRVGALFPRYGTGKGSGSTSAALLKVLRNKANVTDKKVTIHSIRHTLKDLMRRAQISKEMSDMIQGHTIGDASSAYGSDDLLEHKAQALIAALQPLEKELLTLT